MTAGALAGFAAAPATASTAQPHAHHPVYERLSGFSNTAVNSINVQTTGGFFDNGTASLHLNGGLTATVSLSQGKQYMHLTPTSITSNLHPGTCSGRSASPRTSRSPAGRVPTPTSPAPAPPP
jgi:hypothetical protein